MAVAQVLKKENITYKNHDLLLSWRLWYKMIYYCTQQDYTFYITNITVMHENDWNILKGTHTVQVVEMIKGPVGKNKHRI